MQTTIAPPLKQTAAGATAEAVLRACVHCGMCNAVCPTFHLAGDERDGPRGRIYLMKQALEGEPVSRESQVHLDRCLSCRACETACPSGVQYHRLLDVGREAIAERLERAWPERLARAAIREVCGNRLALRLGAAISGFAAPRSAAKAANSGRRMLLLRGCVQSVVAPRFNRATADVFDHVGIAVTETAAGSCCGALEAHLDAPDRARRNIAAWTAELDAGAEALIVNASGCAAFIRDYPDLLADEPDCGFGVARVARAVRDPVEILEGAPPQPVRPPREPRIAVHDPCTLANGARLGGRIAALLERLGYEPAPVAPGQACCGSAGAWSLLHPSWARTLRDEKLAALAVGAPQAIVTANIGCWLHFSSASTIPVRHWVEAVHDVVVNLNKPRIDLLE